MNEEQIFGIISYAGDAKGLAYEALDKAEEGDFDKANELIEESNKMMKEAHKLQTKMIHQEAAGDPVSVNIILIHAQDHLMTAMSEKNLIERFIKMYKKMDER
ncbi:PTS lactose/cellobiose transporter subunit IIA [Clostridium sp. D2Q-11]|uniref:PTS lactose/cellobiose transporter subunit IIA n=1 Tax=Anaeromonas frigoriresistens TaxID=2683708 RepID=A0A942Z5V5_9FIRM|nr:PTS lactose/cellobiose transporter subunit IIA [Anaeromonas frigoriresistens]MBS4536887.1 PTS lactose/cellobiose transporter subunit IIA [Anaeromonas frigoriresistens]